ncbi:TadE family type IV pilus minor pilin [Cryobacterium sp. 10S3]|nr:MULTISPECIES: TadE family type IV pilus minor pilin [unclassified Cryobacterium]MEB0002773.1 TadE family type IV pilus minor pilin [Cryobacterium sp. RTC2.1]MEB0201585.1 TadE family type IV pilus minor pilin [Cryobacterium sp. 5I3]MEB0285018.1 TadE family type IV pilus minor pilin [Cryobacterium sp. 10S3]WPX13976.1 TadE family type IV pilus minor pilin [Cryobacterium sp. 10S3]
MPSRSGSRRAASRAAAGDATGTDGSSVPAERGSITAEFAAVIPAVLLVLLLCLGGVQVGGQQVRLADAAAQAARSLARGDGLDHATSLARQLVGGAAVSVDQRGDAVCARLSAPAELGITVTAGSCALGGAT